VKINGYYFKQPAYVMQGVGDTNAIYALPLKGIPELGTGNVSEDPDGGELTWSVTTSDPGIGAEFQDEGLCIWGADADWSGYGEATLMVTDAEGMSDSITIPVTVFRDDKTLINAEGKKDYFVPWSPQLDVNRILSVEEHMRKYNKDEGNLDRTIQWSRWRQMEYLKDATFSTFWPLDLNEPGAFWPLEAQYALVDVLLFELRDVGFDTVRIKDPYYTFGSTATEFHPVYDNFNAGVSKRPEESQYVIDEAHRLGMKVVMSNWIGIDTRSTDGVYIETWQATPDPVDSYWRNYQTLMMTSMQVWQNLGVDIAAIADSLELVRPRTSANMAKTSDWFEEIARSARQYYEGPLTCFTSCQWLPGEYIDEAPFWSAIDVLAPAINDDYKPHVQSFDPTLEELIVAWNRLIRNYFQPFQQRYNKPFLAYHAGCLPIDGGAMWGVQLPGHYPARMSIQYVDLQEQRDWYESVLESFSEMEGFFGLGTFWYDFTHWMLGGVNDINMTPRLKPAEAFLSESFGGVAAERMIMLDGDLSDWDGIGVSIEDPAGDNRFHGDDLIRVQGFQDDAYLYCAIQYTALPAGGLTVWLDTGGDNNWDFSIGIGPIQGTEEAWMGNVGDKDLPGRAVGVADVASRENCLEVRLHRRYIYGYSGPISIRVTDANAAWTGDDDSIPSWMLIPSGLSPEHDRLD